MDKERIIRLLKAYQEQTATAEERKEFSEILHNPRYESLIHQILEQDWDKLTSEEIDALEIPGTDRILKEIKQQPQIVVRKINIWPHIAIAAASILILFSLGLYFYDSRLGTQDTQIEAQNDIVPGKNGATLTLANGKKILIKDALAGNIATESGIKISKTKDGQIIYEVTGEDDGKLSYNTLNTSRGEQTQVRLQDGTVVFLNAESSLTYPTSFAKTKTREVTMVGEAYFQVAKDKKHPFMVETRHQRLEVLGTIFNINSYADEPTIKTTLLEGSVKVTPLARSLSQPKVSKDAMIDAPSYIILKPGEQSILRNFDITTKLVETDDAIAWKNGLFMFSNETLESIMKKVARWYNVDVIYKNDLIKQKTFFGSVSRFANVSDLLNMLQQTSAVVFEIKGNQIIADKKK